MQNDLPVQVSPSPVYPGRQVHVTLPTLLVQLASALQFPLFVAQWSIAVSSHTKRNKPSEKSCTENVYYNYV